MLRFYRQYAVRSAIHAKMDVDALIYGDSNGPMKKGGMTALKLLFDITKNNYNS